MYYIATVLLNMREEDFWRCSPRKLFSLIGVHVKVNNPDEAKPSGDGNKNVAKEIAGW
jgi:hypothetical protein